MKKVALIFGFVVSMGLLVGCQQGEVKPEESAGSPQASVEVPVSGEQRQGKMEAAPDGADGLKTETK